jgi:CheY-like chemotaxis protein
VPAPFATEVNKPVKQRRLFDAITAAPVPAAVGAPAAPAFRLPAGTRVLVAEDHEVNRELMVRQLAKLGLSAHAVATGSEAIRLAGEGEYDVVLMDCQMPEIDGLQAARAIRALEPPGRRTTIVAVTGGATSGEIEATLAAGMDACLTKPFSTAQLGEALARVLPPAEGSALDVLRADVGEEEDVRRIAGLFVSGLRAARAQLDEAVEHSDAVALGNAAHRLRSSSATFRADRLAALSARLESQTAAGVSAGTAGLVAAIGAETERVAARVERELAQDSPSSL